MKTIEIEIPVCECGCEGDMWIQLSDGVLDFAVCHVCGCAIKPFNKGNSNVCSCKGGPKDIWCHGEFDCCGVCDKPITNRR